MAKGGSGLYHGTRGDPQGRLDLGGGGAPHPNAVPGSTSASIPDTKLAGYALNEDHPVGRNKAKVFKSALGYTAKDAPELRRQILSKLPYYPATPGKHDQYGQRYTVDMPITGKNGQTRMVRTGWIIKAGETAPSLTTAYVL